MATIQPLNATVATPAAHGFAYLLDSTRWGQSIAGTLQPTATLSTPGTDRDWMTMRQIVGSVHPVAQAVTLKFYTLSAGAWVHQTALDVACPAGQPTAIEFSPAAYGSADGMVAMQAGATAPSSISGSATISDVSSESIADTLLTTVGDTLVKTAAGFTRLPAPAVGSVKTGSATDPNGQVDLVLNQDNIPSGTTAKQYNPAAVAETGGTSKDVVHSDSVTAGEAILAGYGVGVKDATGPKWYRSSGASATALLCSGIATAAASGTGQSLGVQSVGVTGVIPDAAFDTLPTAAQVGLVVYPSRTILGGFTLDVSAFVTTDVVQPLGTLSSGGTGNCKIKLAIQKGLTAAQYAALIVLPSTSGLNSSTDKNLITDAEKAVVDSLATGGWGDLQKKRAQSLVPALTDLYPFKLGGFPNGVPTLGTGVTDSGLTGGCLTFANASYIALSPIIVANCKTSPWAFGYRGRCGSLESYVVLTNGTNRVGIYSSNAAPYLQIDTWYGDTVRLQSSWAIDPAVDHDFAVLFNLTSLYLTVDGVVVATQSTLTQVPTTAGYLAIYVNSGNVKARQAFYAWVAP